MKKEITVDDMLAIGFEHAAIFSPSILEPRTEVREMCSSDKCRIFGRSWSCPPACGTIEESFEKIKKYMKGIMLQTTAQMEDSFDVETMMSASDAHKERFAKAVELLRAYDPDCLPMGTGGCTVCGSCTYPDAPCRFPEKAFTSMEAYGLLVSAECKKAGLEYNYGKNTLTYTACILFN